MTEEFPVTIYPEILRIPVERVGYGKRWRLSRLWAPAAGGRAEWPVPGVPDEGGFRHRRGASTR
jgi:hypothetical protein